MGRYIGVCAQRAAGPLFALCLLSLAQAFALGPRYLRCGSATAIHRYAPVAANVAEQRLPPLVAGSCTHAGSHQAAARAHERALPFEAVVEAILALRPTVDRIGLRQHPTIGPRRQKVEFCIRVKRDLIDAFFNGPNGYRAEFLRGGCNAALSIDRRVVDRIAAAYSNELRSVPGGWKSIASPQAKVWIRQNNRQTEALYGRTRPVPDIDVPNWIERMDTAVPAIRAFDVLPPPPRQAVPACQAQSLAQLFSRFNFNASSIAAFNCSTSIGFVM